MGMNNCKNEYKKFSLQAKEAIKELFSKKWYHQIPNLLTFSRGIAPFVVLPLFFTGNILASVIAEGIFALTDFFDGKIARIFNFKSEFGKTLDTICDKIFAITLLLPIYTIIPTIGITIGLEVLIATINSISKIKGNEPASSLLGKSKTFLLSGSIILAYLSMLTAIPMEIVTLSFAITSVLQAGAAIDYYVIDKFKDTKKENKEVINEEKTNNKPKNNKNKEEKIIEYRNDFPIEKEITKRKKLNK